MNQTVRYCNMDMFYDILHFSSTFTCAASAKPRDMFKSCCSNDRNIHVFAYTLNKLLTCTHCIRSQRKARKQTASLSSLKNTLKALLNSIHVQNRDIGKGGLRRVYDSSPSNPKNLLSSGVGRMQRLLQVFLGTAGAKGSKHKGIATRALLWNDAFI